MYETTGLHGGLCGQPQQAAHCRAGRVLRGGAGCGEGLGERGVRARLQPCAGGVETFAGNDTDIIAAIEGAPRPIRWIAYAFGLLCFTGVAPMALAAAVIGLFDALDCWWVLPAAFAAVCVWAYRRCGI